MFKKVLIGIGLLLLLLAAGGYYVYDNLEKYVWPTLIKPEYASVDITKPLNEQTVTFTMAGRTFRIPKAYIDGRVRGKEITGLNLLFIYPDFTSYLEERMKGTFKKAWEEDRDAHMLIDVAALSPSFDERISNIQIYERDEYLGKYGDFERYRFYIRTNNRPNNDLYIEKNAEGKIVGIVSCALYVRITNSYGCDYEFVDQGIRYNIFFNKKKYLDKTSWIKSEAIKFINNFEIKSGDIK